MLVQQLEEAVIVNEIGFLLRNCSEDFAKMSSKVKVSDHAWMDSMCNIPKCFSMCTA